MGMPMIRIYRIDNGDGTYFFMGQRRSALRRQQFVNPHGKMKIKLVTKRFVIDVLNGRIKDMATLIKNDPTQNIDDADEYLLKMTNRKFLSKKIKK